MSHSLDGMIQKGLQENIQGTIHESDEGDSRLGAQYYENRGSFKQQNSPHTPTRPVENVDSRKTGQRSESQVTIDSIERDIRQQLLKNSNRSEYQPINSGEAENEMEDNIVDDVSEVPTVPRN